MAHLASFLFGIFGSLAGFFVKFVTRKWAIFLAVGTVFIAMTAAFAAALHGLLSAASASITNPYLLLGMAAVIPPNLDMVIGTYFSARLVAWAYHLNADLLKMQLGGV